MYRLYGQNKITGWEKITQKKKLEQILNTASKLTPNDYYAYIVIENNGNGDNVLIRESLYKEVEVVYEDIKSTIEVKTTTFQVGKEKEKTGFETYFHGRTKDYGEDDYLNY